ncbi:MAG TPA: hypothetical protein VI636_05395 [Candidatus Angelobacter sp.]
MIPQILIVENEASLLGDYHRYITNIGNDALNSLRVIDFDIVEATCADDAKKELVKAAQQNRPFDLLLLDLGLPNHPNPNDPGEPGNGIAVLDCAQEQRAAKEIVVVSALLKEPKNVIEAVHSGAADFVNKLDFRKEYVQEAVLRSLRRTVARSSLHIFDHRIRSLVPCSEQSLVYGFGICFSRCIQEVGRAEDAIQGELRERLGLDPEQDKSDLLVQQLMEIDRSLQSGRQDWVKQQTLLGLSHLPPNAEKVALTQAIAKLEKDLESCLIVKNATIKNDDLMADVLSFNGDVLTVLSEMILGGLAEIKEEFPRTNYELMLSAEVQENWVDLRLRDNCTTLKSQDARNINEGATIGPSAFDRAWGLSVAQYLALRGGGRLTVEPRTREGNIITYRIPRAPDGQGASN